MLVRLATTATKKCGRWHERLTHFRSEARVTERTIVSVKGGGVSLPMVRAQKGVLDIQKAPVGVFLTLEPPIKGSGLGGLLRARRAAIHALADRNDQAGVGRHEGRHPVGRYRGSAQAGGTGEHRQPTETQSLNSLETDQRPTIAKPPRRCLRRSCMLA